MVDKNWSHEIANDSAAFKEKHELFGMSDALGEYARRLKRNLMTWTALLFVCVFYNVKVTKIPTIDVEIPGGERADALAIIVAVPLLYSLVTYVVHAGADLFHWRQRFQLGLATFTGNAMHRACTHLHVIEQYLARTQEGDPLADNVRPAVDNAKEAVATTNGHLTQLLSDARRLTRSRKLFAYIWELALPVLIAILTLLYARVALVDATGAIWSTL